MSSIRKIDFNVWGIDLPFSEIAHLNLNTGATSERFKWLSRFIQDFNGLNDDAGIVIIAHILPILHGNTFSGTAGTQGVALAGTLAADLSLSPDLGGSYVSHDFAIDTGATLTLPAGTVFKLSNGLDVRGTLLALTSLEKIYGENAIAFTGIRTLGIQNVIT